MFKITEKLKRRFWAKVNREEGGCWIWSGSQDKGVGYGRIKIEGKNLRASRVSYTLATGKDPREMVVRHTCGNKSCVNPEHLALCKRGHEIRAYTDYNGTKGV